MKARPSLLFALPPLKPVVEWKVSGCIEYGFAVQAMQRRAEKLADNKADELVWLLEHPPLVSQGRSSSKQDILSDNRLPIVHASRGGQTTCHLPGQRIVYFALSLRRRNIHVREFVRQVGDWVCATLATWNLKARADEEAVGVWVASKKIAAMGFRVSRGVATHGVALNRSVDLSLYRGIVACGLGGEEVATSMEKEGVQVSREELDIRLKETCPFL